MPGRQDLRQPNRPRYTASRVGSSVSPVNPGRSESLRRVHCQLLFMAGSTKLRYADWVRLLVRRVVEKVDASAEQTE